MVNIQDALTVLNSPVVTPNAKSLAESLIVVKLLKELANEGFIIEDGKLVPKTTQNESISS